MSENTTPATTPTPTETLFGGTDVIISRNGSSLGETVKVRQLKIGDYPTLLRCMDDEAKMAELYCGQPAGWAEGLSMESLETVITEGERVNGDFFSRWVQRRLARQERLVPGLGAKMADAVLHSSGNKPA